MAEEKITEKGDSKLSFKSKFSKFSFVFIIQNLNISLYSFYFLSTTQGYCALSCSWTIISPSGIKFLVPTWWWILMAKLKKVGLATS